MSFLDFSDKVSVSDILQMLKLVLDVWKMRPHKNKDTNTPDTKALEEVIVEVERLSPSTEQTEQTQRLNKAIEEKLSESDADTLKIDLAALSVIANPPSISNYDFWLVLKSYADAVRAMAIRAELFKIKGHRTGIIGDKRELAIPKTAGVFFKWFRDAKLVVNLPYEGYDYKLTNLHALLTDGADHHLGISLIPEVKLLCASCVGESYSKQAAARYIAVEAADKNWLYIERKTDDFMFAPFAFRLEPKDTLEIMRALKEDVFHHLGEVEKERADISEIEEELLSVQKPIKPVGS